MKRTKVALRVIEWVLTLWGIPLPMDGSSLLQREVRRDFSWLERSSPARPLFVARLVGRQTVRLSTLAAPDPWSVVRHILIGRAPNAERHLVRRRVLPPVHKNQRYSLRWVLPIELHTEDLFSPQAVPQV